MKKAAVIAGCLCLFLYTSCLDTVQSVSFENEIYTLTYRFAFQKKLISDIGVNSSDFMDFFTVNGTIQEHIVIEEINTSSESGFVLTILIDSKTHDEKLLQLLPIKKGNTITIPVFPENTQTTVPGQSKTDNMETLFENTQEKLPQLFSGLNDIFKDFFNDIKYRVVISKNLIPRITSATLIQKNKEELPLVVTDQGDKFSIELPVAQLLQEKNSAASLKIITNTRIKKEKEGINRH